MVNIRRAYEVLFLGLFLFFLFITDLRDLNGWPVSLFLEATPLVAVATALTTHTIYRNLVWGLVDHRHHHDGGPSLVQLDVPIWDPPPFLRLDRQSPQHQADDRGQPVSKDLCDQVLHPGRDDRDGRAVDHPDRDRCAGRNLGGLPGSRVAADRRFLASLLRSRPASPVPPKCINAPTARCKLGFWTRLR